MTLHELNTLPDDKKREALMRCCGSTSWVNKMISRLPAEDLIDLIEDAEEEWRSCSKEDWMEAFSHHPKIGDTRSIKHQFASTAEWASEEQERLSEASGKLVAELQSANQQYLDKFGYIFIICATGKSGDDMLQYLETRLKNNPETEIEIAAEEQLNILKLRLRKLLDDPTVNTTADS